ncbi:Soluble lytic murein transglycosylase [Micromonospora nigra]|uniref:Soluble lytic murein transglycosylase n=1 Tax=Micromonospora nigra TaxID=145857 RepID=A0A1C6RER9_9ACTN|nr:lytic transglycosylase domain-containing protein [Micromonospora nigra]SCL15662.1 Soluble lytic murein transglycosylase [Micromonospora nigra]
MRRSVVSAVVAVAVLLTAAGCAGQERRPSRVAAPVALPEVEGSDEARQPDPSPTTAEPEETPSSRPSPTAKAKPKPKPKPKPSRSAGPRAVPRPPTETKLPPPPPVPSPSGCKPSYQGKKATRGQVKAALTDAAQRTYWPTSAPQIRIPLALVKATAWQESGWQSHIVACDGGIGLMQVMPDTAVWMNQRFEQSYDVDDHRDNAYLGGTYLAWLTKYLGDMYFDGDYRLDAALCTADLDSCLLNAVIAAYNYGHAAVAREGRPLVVPNPGYVRNVRALMTGCVCLDY